MLLYSHFFRIFVFSLWEIFFALNYVNVQPKKYSRQQSAYFFSCPFFGLEVYFHGGHTNSLSVKLLAVCLTNIAIIMGENSNVPPATMIEKLILIEFSINV